LENQKTVKSSLNPNYVKLILRRW